MPMRATTVRFGEALWNLIEREANRDGVSAAQYVRDATILRTAYAMGERRDPSFEAAIDRATRRDQPPDGATLDDTARRQALLDAADAVDDPARVDALRATGLLDSDVTPSFDRLARLAAH